MTIFKSMINTLQDKPAIGVIAAFIASFFVSVKDFMTDDTVLNDVRIIGIWLGILIAVLTLAVKIFEIVEKIKKYGRF